MSKIVNKILFAILLLMSTLVFSQSVKEQYNNAIEREIRQKKYSTERLEINYRNAKIYLCTNDYYHSDIKILNFNHSIRNPITIIGPRIIYYHWTVRMETQFPEDSLKYWMKWFDRESSIYTRSGGELSWNSSNERFTFDSQELTLYINNLGSRSLKKQNCILYKDTDKSSNQSAVPASKPPPPNQNQPTINRPSELEKTVFLDWSY